MTPTTPRRSPEELARIGEEIYDRCIRPLLKPEDNGRYVAIDVATEEYEIDDNDYAATTRLSARRPGAEIWLLRVGQPVRLSYRMRFGQ